MPHPRNRAESEAWGEKRGNAARLHRQTERLFRAIVTFEHRREMHKTYVDMRLGREWAVDPKKIQQDNLRDSWVDLGKNFYEAVTAVSVPVDLRALRELRSRRRR
jgi:hypothetical protein